MEKSDKADKPLIDINNNKNQNPRKISRTQQKPIFHTQLSDQQNATTNSPNGYPYNHLYNHNRRKSSYAGWQQQQQQPTSSTQILKQTPINISLHPFWPFMHFRDNITARWEGFPMPKQQNLLDGDDVGTLLTSQLEGDEEGKAPLTCTQKIIKVVHQNPSATHCTSCCPYWLPLPRGKRPIQQELLAPERLDNIHNKWTFPTALLYVLTVLTTCGYSEVSVNTDVGKIFSVIFALVGIPLMFITAADIGKFLSDTLLRIIAEWKLMTRRVKRIAYDLFYAQKSGKLRRKSLQSISVSLGALELADIGSKDDTNLWFPIGAYVLCICVYCSFGSIMFMNWEEKWSFIHSFHFGFNLIVTVGLGDIVVTDYLFLSLIVAFVIVGLAVVTMCVDLASTHLKNYFAKIHYFGRAKRFLGMSEELREIVTLLGVLKRKKHGKITLDDVCNFLENELYNRAYEPHELLRKLRFIDENTLSSTLSTMRHNSFQSDFLRDAEYLRRLRALRPDQPVYL
uniref:Potassium channel domain-containing protein n=1 Tax=Meloidogyne floridensis TaxID=298350 RepID=A0A915P4W4_9BILA